MEFDKLKHTNTATLLRQVIKYTNVYIYIYIERKEKKRIKVCKSCYNNLNEDL